MWEGQSCTVTLASTGFIQAKSFDISTAFKRNGELWVILRKASNLFGKTRGRGAIFDLQIFMASHALFVCDLCQLLLAFVLDMARNTRWGHGLCSIMQRAVMTFETQLLGRTFEWFMAQAALFAEQRMRS